MARKRWVDGRESVRSRSSQYRSGTHGGTARGHGGAAVQSVAGAEPGGREEAQTMTSVAVAVTLISLFFLLGLALGISIGLGIGRLRKRDGSGRRGADQGPTPG